MSGAVYSTAKGLDYDWCKSIDKYLPKPDYTFFIDISSDQTSRRVDFGTEVHDKTEFQKKVYNIYKDKAYDEHMHMIDGTQEPEKIADCIMKYLK
jgi:dTMP kinase